MSDARLRELERRWHESGALEDEVAFLNARVRAGDLLPMRVLQAAACGHEAALRASDAELPPPLSNAWTAWLRAEPGELHARVALAFAREVQPEFTRLLPSDHRLARALVAAGRLLDGPTDATAKEEVLAAVPGLVDAIEDRARRSDFLRVARCAASAALAATECAALFAGLGVVHWRESTFEAASAALANATEVARTRDGRVPPEHLDRLCMALRTSVAPWLLTPTSPTT